MLIVCNVKRHDCWSGATVTDMPDVLMQSCLPAPRSNTSIDDITGGLRQV